MSAGLQVPLHSLRMETADWQTFGEKVRQEPRPVWRSRAAVIRALIDVYMSTPADMDALLRGLGESEGEDQ